jgi:hypothetical protein
MGHTCRVSNNALHEMLQMVAWLLGLQYESQGDYYQGDDIDWKVPGVVMEK